MNDISADRCDPLLLIEALRQSGKSLETALDTELVRVGLSAAKWAALRCLVENGEHLPLSQLADKLACVRSNATQLVDRLEADNLVRRTSDPNDRRSVSAELTEGGRARYNEGLGIMREFERSILSDYTHEEYLLISKLLTKLHNFTHAAR
ncbi:MAG: MarR family transcriptional regulator [Chloroflexia bacterium]